MNKSAKVVLVTQKLQQVLAVSCRRGVACPFRCGFKGPFFAGFAGSELAMSMALPSPPAPGRPSKGRMTMSAVEKRAQPLESGGLLGIGSQYRWHASKEAVDMASAAAGAVTSVATAERNGRSAPYRDLSSTCRMIFAPRAAGSIILVSTTPRIHADPPQRLLPALRAPACR